MRGSLLLRIVSVLVVMAAVAGIGVAAYNAGVAQGVASGGEGAASVPFYRPLFFPGFGLLFCLPFLLLFFLFPLFGMRRWGWRKHPREWGDRVPPMVEEWHRRMHGQPTGSDPESRPANAE